MLREQHFESSLVLGSTWEMVSCANPWIPVAVLTARVVAPLQIRPGQHTYQRWPGRSYFCSFGGLETMPSSDNASGAD